MRIKWMRWLERRRLALAGAAAVAESMNQRQPAAMASRAAEPEARSEQSPALRLGEHEAMRLMVERI